MKKITLALLLTTFALLTVKTASASGTTCQPIYGGGQTCSQSGSIAVEKKVVGTDPNKLGPESIVTFQITVKNTGGTKINRVEVKDIFPQQYLDFGAGAGSFDTGSKVLSFDVNDLNPNETRTFNIVGKVVPATQLPMDQGIVCIPNQATAKDSTDNGQPSRSTVQLCIQKNLPAVGQPEVTIIPGETKGGLKVFPPQKVFTAPATGPEALPLMALIPTGALGAFLRRKAFGK